MVGVLINPVVWSGSTQVARAHTLLCVMQPCFVLMVVDIFLFLLFLETYEHCLQNET